MNVNNNKKAPTTSGIDKDSLARFKMAKGNIGENLEIMNVDYNVTEAYARVAPWSVRLKGYCV